MTENKNIGLCQLCESWSGVHCSKGISIQGIRSISHCSEYKKWEDKATHGRINHPKHYNAGKIEAIAVIEDWNLGFNLGNAIKYVARADHKENKIQDLEKARWYIDREINNLKALKKEILE